MTRETKIGLLVGLAFIIVVGILLSEHLTTTVERPTAPLADAGRTVGEGVSAPGANSSLDAPPVRMPEPGSPVSVPSAPIAREIQSGNPGATHVAIGGPTGQSPIVIDNRTQPGNTEPEAISTVGPVDPVLPPSNPTGPIVTRTPTDPFANDPLRQIANNIGEQLVPINGVTNKPADKISTTTLAANNVREYQAQAGDSLSRIAALLPGGNTKANRDAVVNLNPILQKDPNKVIAGRKYLLPTEAGVSKPTPVPAPLVQQASVVEKKPEEKKPDANANAFRTYTVQKGDSLTKIAVEQLGSKSEITTIRKLNADVLKNGDVIRIDMKLKLPVKQQVAANQ